MALPEGARTTFKLQDWQCALLSWLFGFFDKEGHRAISECNLIIPRKAGKSSIAAGFMLASLVEPMGDVVKPEILILGENLETTDIVFGKIRSILEGDSRSGGEFQKKFGVRHTKTRVFCKHNGGYIEKLSANARSLEGRTAAVVFADEISRMPTQQPLDVIRTGLGHNRDALLFTATTPSDLPTSAMEPTRDKTFNWLDDDTMLGSTMGLCYEAPMKAKHDDEKVWVQVQPSLDVIVFRKWYREQAKLAEASEADLRAFETRLLCKPLSGGAIWVGQRDLEELIVVEDKENAPLGPQWIHYIGCDFSDVSDTTSMCLLSINERGGSHGEGIQEARWKIFYPRGDTQFEDESGNETNLHANKVHKMYGDAAARGHIEQVAGRTMNHKLVAQYLMDWILKYRPRGIVCDDFDVVHEVRSNLPQNFHKLFMRAGKSAAMQSAPAGALEGWIKRKTLSIDGNPVVLQHFRNTHVKEMPGGGFILTKVTPDSKYKIDSVDALVNAVAGFNLAMDPKYLGTAQQPFRNDGGDEAPLTLHDLIVHGRY